MLWSFRRRSLRGWTGSGCGGIFDVDPFRCLRPSSTTSRATLGCRPGTFAPTRSGMFSFSIAGAQTGIVRGLHPVVCATLGVTICFGGIARDLLCRRDVALGAENFAAATGFGAAVYVSLRQLMLRGLPLPLWTRTVITGTAVVGLRYWAWLQRPEPLLGRMQYRDFTIDSRAARASSGISRRMAT